MEIAEHLIVDNEVADYETFVRVDEDLQFADMVEDLHIAADLVVDLNVKRICMFLLIWILIYMLLLIWFPCVKILLLMVVISCKDCL